MKKNHLGLWITGVAAVVVLIFGGLLTVRVITNKNFVRAYENEDYSTEDEEKLLVMNNPEGYVPYYNLGNASFKKGDYNAAISYYKEALKKNPPEDKECNIRINLALTMCYTIDFNGLDTQDKRNEAIKTLESAKAMLLEKGFATNNGDGSSADAQQLKDDIDRMIEKLKQNGGGDGSGDNNSDENNSDDSTNDNGTGSESKEDRIKNELEKNRKEAQKQDREMKDNMEKWSDYFHDENGEDAEYDWTDKTW